MVYAASSKSYSLDGMSVGVQRFEWREFADNGSTLLKEQGHRVTFGAEEHNLNRRYPGIIYRAAANVWLGTVDYSGTTYNATSGALVPISTSTDYIGGSVSALMGQRYGYLSRNQILDLTGGVEMNAWLRNLRSGYNDLGQFAQGYRELYRIWAVKAAAALRTPFGRGRGYLQVGAKLPFYTSELVSNPRVLLSPGRNISFFARVDLTNLIRWHQNGLQVVAYYDSYRFTPSAVRANVQQPESHMDVIGVSLVFRYGANPSRSR